MNNYYLIPMSDKNAFIGDYSLRDILKLHFKELERIENEREEMRFKFDVDDSISRTLKRQYVEILKFIYFKYEEENIPDHIVVKKDNNYYKEIYTDEIISANYDIAKYCQKISEKDATKYLQDNKYFNKIKNYINKVFEIRENNVLDFDELLALLLTDKPSIYLKSYEEGLFNLVPELRKTKGFDQHSKYHNLDVYDHTLKVIDNTPRTISLRLAALFHDIGKVKTFSVDEDGQGHFYNHWNESKDIFLEFAKKLELDYNITNLISKLIEYHDLDMSNEENFDVLRTNFNNVELLMLLTLKRADLIAQNSKYNNIGKMERGFEKILKRG